MKDFFQKLDKRGILMFVLTVLGAGGALWTLKTIGVQSVWNWTFIQDKYWEDIIEICILFVVLAIAIGVPRQNSSRFFAIFAVSLVFAYRHAMFYPLLIMCLYAGMICMTGHLICRLLCKEWKNNLLACILVGLSSIIILVAFCSLLKIGTPENLRIVYIVLFLLELVLCWNEIRKILLSLLTTEDNCGFRFSTRGLVFAGIITAFMVQLGRACIALDYDSLWYGVRSDTMLAPFTGIYDKVISTGMVYAYPKGFETLSLAFSSRITYSYVYGVNLMLVAMLLYAIYRTARLFCKSNVSYFVVLFCSVTPGIMNMSVTAKSDIVTLFTQLLTLYFAIRALKENSSSALMLSISAAVLSFCFKPSSFIFTTSMIIPAVFLFVIRKIRVKGRDVAVVGFPVMANLLLMLRTWLLTGLPIKNFGTDIQQSLGFSYNFPYTEASSNYVMSLSEFFSNGVFCERLPRLKGFLFEPTEPIMDHVIIAWGGVLFSICWLWLVIYVFSNPKRTWKKMCADSGYAYSLLAVAIISAASMGSMLLLTKPDGNYFMLMYALTFLHLAIEMRDISKDVVEAGCKRFVPLAVAGMMLCMLTSGAWSVGLTPVVNNGQTYYNHAEQNAIRYNNIGLGDIPDALAEKGGKSRIMVVSNEEPWLLSLPAIAESWFDLLHWGPRELCLTAEGLLSYYEATGTEYLVLERDSIAPGAAAASATNSLLSLAQNGQLRIEISAARYLLLAFDADGSQVDQELCAFFTQVLNSYNG